MSTEIKNTKTTRDQVYDDDEEFHLPMNKKIRDSEATSETSNESVTAENSQDERLQRMASALKTLIEVSFYNDLVFYWH